MSKSEAKISISKDERKQLKIFKLKWNADRQMLHQVTNRQPNDYKEPINKSQDKVRGYSNTVNKYMSSEMEENFISQNQFTDILTMDTSQSNRRRCTFCTIYN
jgi:CRISPR/Cas system CMR-associated protein Cmr1 (group 7 of RAMP superfamily)